MIGGRYFVSDSIGLEKSFELGINEVGAIVTNDCLGESKSRENVAPKKISKPLYDHNSL